MDFRAVAPAELPAVWPLIKPLIAGAAARSCGRIEAVDIRAGVETGTMQLWLATDGKLAVAVVATQIVIYPRARVCRIRLVTGVWRRQWQQQAIETLEAWARKEGCQIVEGLGRPGWARVARQFGYKHTHSLVEKRL